MGESKDSLELMIDHFNGNRAHIQSLQKYLHIIVTGLLERGRVHDEQKYLEPEASAFAQVTHKLKDLTYDSKEYNDCKKSIDNAIQHHYNHCSHHPEFYGAKGINGMDLLDLIEMFVDWKAASERHKDGDFNKSIEKSIDRFHIDPMLANVLRNSAYLFKEIK